jgi:hypothetical protein
MSQKLLCTCTINDKLALNVRKLAEEMGVSYGSICIVLKKHLHLHPYKMTTVHELKERDVKQLNTVNGLGM